MTTICHVSDTHGVLFPLQDADIVVHSGDFMPNKTRGIVPIEEHWQESWVAQNINRLKAWIGDRPFLFVPGNHDYYDPVPRMQAAGIDARDACGHHWWFGKHFYGFHWVPYFCGEWNNEVSENKISQIFGPTDADIIVAHSPFYGVLDRNVEGERCGSKAIRAYLQDENNAVPSWYLCGHIHQSAGVQGWSRGIKVSNAATTCRVIEL